MTTPYCLFVCLKVGIGHDSSVVNRKPVFPFKLCTTLLPNKGFTKGMGVRAVNGLRSQSDAAEADAPRVGSAQMPTAIIIGRIANMTSPAVMTG